MKKSTFIIRLIFIIILGLAIGFGGTHLIYSSIHNKVQENVIEEGLEEGKEKEVEEQQVEEKDINLSTTEIPEAYIEDEINLEEQEVESEAFELQGEIAYNGASELPTIPVGQYYGLTYYSQIDSRWKNLPYTSTNNPTQTIGSSACGPTCAAMIVSSIRGNIDVPTMCQYFVDYGFRSASNGTYWSAFRWTADVFDIEYIETIYLDKACELLQDGYYLVTACGNGLFTTGGHFIMLYEYDGTYIKVYDPYLYSGKFNTSTRRGKAIVDGNTVLVTKSNFRNYANYGTFFCFKNDNTKPEPTPVPTPTPVISPYKRVVKVSSSLNVRTGPGTGYSYVRSLYNGNEVTVYEENGNWCRIGNGEWVYADYLTDSINVRENTVGQYKVFKANTTLYSRSDLSGTEYSYLKGTKVLIKENTSATVDKIYVPATGRTAYVDTAVYKETGAAPVAGTLTGTTQKFKGNTTIWANNSMSGTYYSYLPGTSVKVLEDLGDIDRIYVSATGRYGYVYENVYR